jgi:hypothetical protein
MAVCYFPWLNATDADKDYIASRSPSCTQDGRPDMAANSNESDTDVSARPNYTMGRAGTRQRTTLRLHD